MPLSKFPKTFGLTELAKGYFPHFFNTEANQHYVGPLPETKYDDPDSMKPDAPEAFYKWYGQGGKGFVQDQPFELCITIASLCNLVFRTMFLKKETIAIIPHVGTGRKPNSLRWPIVGSRMWHSKIFTFNMVAMPERDAGDRTFWVGDVKIHTPLTSFTDAFTMGAPSAFL